LTARRNKGPGIALSNATSACEAAPEQVLRWSDMYESWFWTTPVISASAGSK
jgi:hypothetical protein